MKTKVAFITSQAVVRLMEEVDELITARALMVCESSPNMVVIGFIDPGRGRRSEKLKVERSVPFGRTNTSV